MATQRKRALIALAMTGLVSLACSSSKTTTNVISTGTVSGTLTTPNGTGTSPVVGATVTTIPDVTGMAAAPAPSDSDGKYSIDLPTGVYSIVFAGTGVTRKQVDGVTVLAGKTTTLDQALAYSPIVLTLSTPPTPAGFSAPVDLTATATGATGPLTYTWSVTTLAPAPWKTAKAYKAGARAAAGGNVYECTTAGTSATSGSGPSGTTTAADSITDGTAMWMFVGTALAAPAISGTGDGSQASFTTDSLAQIAASGNVKGMDVGNRPSLVPITVGQVDSMTYTVTVTATDGRYSQNTTTTVAPASYSHGTFDAPVGAMIVASDGDMASNVPFASYAWTMTLAQTDSTTTPPSVTMSDKTALLNGAATQNPWFIATAPGDYTLKSNAVNAWAATTAYAAGNYVMSNGNLYKCTTAGTSGTTAPSAVPPATIPTDGTVKWSYQFTPRAIVVHVDSFSGMGTCAACHAPGSPVGGPSAQYAAWPNSAHADFNWKSGGTAMSLFAAGLDGIASSHYSGACVKCHVVGYDPGETGNNGFSDRAAAAGWTFPETLAAGNYASVPADLKALNGIQCESCHGPVGLLNGGAHKPDVSYNAGVCARCHDEAPYHDKYQLWARSPTGHSLRSLALRGAADRSAADLRTWDGDSTVKSKYASYGAGSCARCHTAQGFAAYVKQQLADACEGAQNGEINAVYSCLLNPPGSVPGTDTTKQAALQTYLQTTLGLTADKVEPQTCQACHDPHTTSLRLEDDTHMLPSGFRVQNAGAGALCMLCHNSRNGARGDNIGVDAGTNFPYAYFKVGGADTFVRAVGSPHDQTAADIFAGKNAFFTASSPGKHLQYVTDTCVGCHVSLPGLSGSTTSSPNHTFRVDEGICSSCHSNATALTDPATGIEAQYEAGMADLKTASGSAATAAITALDAAAVTNTGSHGAVQVRGSNRTVAVALNNVAGVTGPGTNSTSRNPSDVQLVLTFTTPISDPNNADPATCPAQPATCKTVTSFVISPSAQWDTTNNRLAAGSFTWVSVDQTNAAAANKTVFAPGGLLARALWNNALLTRDMSKGVHNATYVSNIVASTKAVLAAYTSSGALPANVTAP